MLRRRGAPPPSAEEERGDSNNGGDGSDRREGGAAKELSALLLSAMLLGNPQLSDAAAVTQGAAGTVDPTAQARLIAGLEKRLMSMTASSDSDAAAAAAASPAARADATTQKTVSAAGASDVEDAPRIQPMFVPPTAAPSSQTPAAAAEAAAARAPTQASSATTTTTTTSRSSSSKSKGPLITMKDYSFSIKLPELNLPPVAPITVPAEGSPFADLIDPKAVFKAPSSERVAAQPDFPGAGAVREALQSVARGEGVKDLAHALAVTAPKQADYHR